LVADFIADFLRTFKVLAPIEFNNDTGRVFDEVEDVRPKRRLASEVKTDRLQSAQSVPELPLNVGRTSAQRSCAV
jgi:hypothetical protein